MQKAVALDRPRHGNGDARQQLAFREAADRGLVTGMVADARLREQRIPPRDVVVEKDALPGNQHVVEHADRVRLLEARAERMIPLRLRAGVERLAADEAQPRRRGGNAESEDVAFVARTNAG